MIKGNSLRIGGLNSGLDTEAIVNAMTASTKLRITTNQRKILQLEAQQTAYRSIIGKFNAFRDKYFDSLNQSTWLRGASTFSRHTATMIDANGVKITPPGIRVAAGVNAAPGTYNVVVQQAATQSSLTSKKTDEQSSKFDVADYGVSDPDKVGKTFVMNVNVGGTNRLVSFKGAATEAEVTANLNAALADTFGKKTDGTGIVSLDNGNIISSEKKSVSVGKVSELKESVTLQDLLSGTSVSGQNSLTFVIDGETKTVEFSTVTGDHFEALFNSGYVGVNADGVLELNLPGAETLPTVDPLPTNPTQAERDTHAAQTAARKAAEERNAKLAEDNKPLVEAFNIYKEMVDDMYRNARAKAFDDWKDHAGYNADFKSITLTAVESAEERANSLPSGAVNLTALRTEFTDGGVLDEEKYAEAVNNHVNKYIADDRATKLVAHTSSMSGTNEFTIDLAAIRDKHTHLSGDLNFTAYNAEVNKAVNDHIAAMTGTIQGDETQAQANTRARAGATELVNATNIAVNKAVEDKHLNKILDSMSSEQIALFEYEVARQTAANKQNDYSKAVEKSYDDFWKWQQEQGAKLTDGNWISINEYKEMFNIPNEVPASGDWKDVLPGSDTNWHTTVQNYYADKTAANNTKIADTQAAIDLLDPTDNDDAVEILRLEAEIAKFENENQRFDTVSAYWDGKDFSGAVTAGQKAFVDAEKNFNDYPLNQLTFIRGVYNEPGVFGRYYEDGNAGGNSSEEFEKALVENWLDPTNSGTPQTLTDIADSLSLELAMYFNQAGINQKVGNLTFNDGTKLEVEDKGDGTFEIKAYKMVEDTSDPTIQVKEYVDFSAFANPDSKNTLGLETDDTKETTAVSTNTALKDLAGLTANDDGLYEITLNGVTMAFAGDRTVSQMMSAINANTAMGVNISFSSFENEFVIKSREFGTTAKLDIGDDKSGLLAALGFAGQDVKAGENLQLSINGQTVETSSNSYVFNGISITVDPTAKVGTEFALVVERDTSALADMVKEFVKDYNELIEYVFGYTGERPDRDYYFLTDTDREELGLTESQEKKWEERAMKGLLYNDRALNTIMSRMRTTMTTGVPRGDGASGMFGLFSMGITTTSNWRDNGKLAINEAALMNAIENNIELVADLFTNTESGLMTQLDSVIKYAVNPLGARSEKGVLIQKAGMLNSASVHDNVLADEIKRVNDMIERLEMRYTKQQDRFWKIFSSLEQQMGVLQGQGDYITGMMAGMFPQNK
ncbi:MAG: flagellar filament capping protein FliD [Oscillospiraceae bacterium]|nr:flagellar filament capping protein FliD [Oscillospiraceae bacterium]